MLVTFLASEVWPNFNHEKGEAVNRFRLYVLNGGGGFSAAPRASLCLIHPRSQQLKSEAPNGKNAPKAKWKLFRVMTVRCLFVLGLGVGTGCATVDTHNTSEMPWNRPQDWEGPSICFPHWW